MIAGLRRNSKIGPSAADPSRCNRLSPISDELGGCKHTHRRSIAKMASIPGHEAFNIANAFDKSKNRGFI
jgi:hypothetical protein